MGSIEIAEGAVPAPAVRWLFAGFVLDESTLELSRDGRLLPIERKPLEALLFMLQHSGEVVTKEELLAAVWPGRILSDTALAKCISRLREVLGDQNQTLVKTAHGYGYRFAGSPRTEVIAREAPPLLAELKAGDHPPLRPLWTLESRIGSGGMGDAWKVRHDKTGELRIFKFARDPGRLTALKREITLYRLIRNTLEDEAPIVTLLDWNLEQPPYFIESRQADGGSLADWWVKVGGAAAISLEERIELIARIADGLAAIHSIGVLHKDLKPSNVLLELGADGRPSRVMLGDLGSGGLSDPARMEAMGITRMGFTRTLMNAPGSSGTPMYLAPEVLMGQPPTVQADIYALGIMLYQLVIGDLSRPLAPGWEREVADEILREDIARSVDGEAARRLASAADLAQRLRMLVARRAERDDARLSKLRMETAQRDIERMKARRTGMLLAIAALFAGLIASVLLYGRSVSAKREAEVEARRAEAVSGFLNQDVLAQISSDETSKRNLSVKQLLDGASAEVDRRFVNQVDIAAKVNESLGRSYWALEYDREAQDRLAAALDYYEKSGDKGATASTVELASELVGLDWVTGLLAKRLPEYKSLLDSATKERGASDLAVLRLRSAIARGRIQMGYWSEGAAELQQILGQLKKQREPDAAFLNVTESALLYVLLDLADYSEAEILLARLMPEIVRQKGERSQEVAWAYFRRGLLRAKTQHFVDAQRDYATAKLILGVLVNDDSNILLSVRGYEAQLELEDGHPDRAITILLEVLATVAQRDQKEIDQTFNEKRPLAEAYRRLGRLDEAEKAIGEALVSAEKLLGAGHPKTLDIRTLMAKVLHEKGDDQRARALLPSDADFDVMALPVGHPFRLDARTLRHAITHQP